jgi:hypothetical protein
MRLEKFVGTQELVLDELVDAVLLELAEGAEPDSLAQFLIEKVELPRDEAEAIVGWQNARLPERMHFIADRLEQRDRPADLAGGLVDEGWPFDLARDFVARTQRGLVELARTPAGRDQLLAKSRRRMLYGIAWFSGGVFATWLTQYAAEHGNGSYVLLAWGPIIYGLVLFGYSAFQWCRYAVRRA